MTDLTLINGLSAAEAADLVTALLALPQTADGLAQLGQAALVFRLHELIDLEHDACLGTDETWSDPAVLERLRDGKNKIASRAAAPVQGVPL